MQQEGEQMSAETRFKIGDVVRWVGNGLGKRQERVGKIIRIGTGITANVRSGGKMYSPYISWLRAVEKSPEQKMRDAAEAMYAALKDTLDMFESECEASFDWCGSAICNVCGERASQIERGREVLAAARGESA